MNLLIIAFLQDLLGYYIFMTNISVIIFMSGREISRKLKKFPFQVVKL